MILQVATIVMVLAVLGPVQGYPHFSHRSGLTRAELQSLEKALFMRLIQNEIARVQSGVCNSKYNQGQQGVLTDDLLNAMLNLITKASKNTRTYLYVPASETGGNELIVRSTGKDPGTQHAEDVMWNALKNLPGEFYITNSPCTCCARNLITRYQNILNKAKIHFIHFYHRPRGNQKAYDLAVECIGKMIYSGFTFVPWDLKKFNTDFINTVACKDIIPDALSTHEVAYNQELSAGAAALSKAQVIANSIKTGKLDADQVCKTC